MESEDKVTVTVSADDIYRLMREIKNLKAVNVELRKDIDASHKAQDCLRAEFAAYRLGEAEREANIRRQNEREYQRRVEVLNLIERKSKAYSEYLQSEGLALNEIKTILRSRITKKDEAKINTYLDSITKACEKFDAVQKQITKESGVAPWGLDIFESEMPPQAVKEGAKE